MATENKGKRIDGARVKGAEAAAKGKDRSSNPYERPNMAAAWYEGFDSFEPADESEAAE